MGCQCNTATRFCLLHLFVACSESLSCKHSICVAAAAAIAADVQWSLGQAGVGAAGVAMCFVWLATAHKLGQHHKQLVTVDAAVREKMAL
jgi:hypothetical protein